MIKEENLRKIGQFAKPHGVKGEIALITDYDIAAMSGDPYIVCNIDDIRVPFFIKSYRQKNASTTLVTFENSDSKDKVKFLTGKSAYVPPEQTPSNNERPLSLNDLIGYSIVDDRFGELGTVKEVDDSTLNILLKVDCKGNELLIPIALVTSIQHPHQTMNISLPNGFLEIDKYETAK